MTPHPQLCRCPEHRQLQANRDECYRQLAQAILGPDAPEDTASLARALAEHAKLFKPADQQRLPHAA
jgi:hypothetical protein